MDTIVLGHASPYQVAVPCWLALLTKFDICDFNYFTSLPYFRVKLSCVCLMFAYRKKIMTYSDPMVTYSHPKMTYSYPKVT